MNWGYKIVVTFIVFAALIITMVVISMNEQVFLVSEDYYLQELNYQDQIDRQQNAIIVGDHLKMEYDEHNHEFYIDSHVDTHASIHFYRPADATMDRTFELDLHQGHHQFLNTGELASGLWKVKMSWVENDKEIYIEKTVFK